MSKPRDSNFWQSAMNNNYTYRQYYDRIMELAITSFVWHGLPDTVDPRFLELTLFENGSAVFFRDEVLGYLALQSASGGGPDVYNIPTIRRAYAVNGYSRQLDPSNSVLIYNNYLRTTPKLDALMYAKRLYNIDRAIDVNVNAQKTPILITCEDSQRLSLLNLYKKYDGNEPVIFATSGFNADSINAISTGAPYVSDKLYELKDKLWNEVLTYYGVVNVAAEKKERMVSDEVNKNLGGVFASRSSRELARQDACKQMNKLFGLDAWCEFREPVLGWEPEPKEVAEDVNVYD